MALETLKGVKKIGGFEVAHVKAAEDHSSYFGSTYIHIGTDNAIMFKIQNGPIKENGVNGCQVDTLIHAAREIIEGLNAKFPSPHNNEAIIALDMALDHLHARTQDREARGVEGTSNA